MQFSSSEVVGLISCSWDDKTSSTTGTFPPRFQETAEKVGTENYSTWLMRIVCKNVSLRPTDLFCRYCWNDSGRTPFPATITQLFSQSLSSHTLCSCLDNFSTTNNLCNFRHSNIQQVSTYAFCSWDKIFTQKRNWSSPNNLCKCTEPPSILSTNTSIEWKILLVLKQPNCNVL